MKVVEYWINSTSAQYSLFWVQGVGYFHIFVRFHDLYKFL